jgi:hypothetical protein
MDDERENQFIDESLHYEQLREREELRVQRWHDTYNAALTGVLRINPGWTPEEIHALCARHADAAHGPLKG